MPPAAPATAWIAESLIVVVGGVQEGAECQRGGWMTARSATFKLGIQGLVKDTITCLAPPSVTCAHNDRSPDGDNVHQSSPELKEPTELQQKGELTCPCLITI